MQIIYIDSLFLLNFFINYLLLLCTARVSGLVLKRSRYFIAATFGGIYAIFSVITAYSFLQTGLIKLSVAGFMAIISYGGERNLLRLYISFLAISAAFSGSIWAVCMFSGFNSLSTSYLPVSFRMLFLSFGISYLIISIVFCRSLAETETEIVKLTIRLNSREVNIKALKDTGNKLREPISAKKIAVAETKSLISLFPSCASLVRETDATNQMSILSKNLNTRVRLVPYSALGLNSALLCVFTADSVLINDKEVKDTLIALASTKLSENGEFFAII